MSHVKVDLPENRGLIYARAIRFCGLPRVDVKFMNFGPGFSASEIEHLFSKFRPAVETRWPGSSIALRWRNERGEVVSRAA